MADEIFYSSLFEQILGDIETKYKTTTPSFKIGQEIITDKEKVDNWISNSSRKHKWVKYKNIGNNIFELKQYFPCPPDEVCYEKIDSAIEGAKNYYKNNNLYYGLNRGGACYNEQQARKEILFVLREGFSEICLHAPELDEHGRNFCGVGFQGIELYWQIDAGFVVLEQK